MKKYLTLFVVVLLAANIFAQTPEKMSYQAVVRDGNNNLVTSAVVSIQISILQGSISGSAVYVETQTPTTNENGLVSIEIGGGTVLSGNFSGINWSVGPYFIKTEIDPTGGTSYTITGTSQLLSVPYALHAKTAETVKQSLNDVLTIGNSAGNKRITNLADPVSVHDATTKSYVDSLIRALEETNLLNNGFTDKRDWNHYNVVKIGNQIWMAENLKYLPSVVRPVTGSQTTPYYYVYGYDGTDVNAAKATANYTTYGVLYNWPAAMAGSASSSSNPSGVQGVCPTGWHLPSDAEWTQLTDYLGGKSVAGGKLKEAGTTHYFSPNTGATNETGFTALPGGSRYDDGSFTGIGGYGEWWSATEGSSSDASYRNMNYFYRSINVGTQSKELGISVRCVRD